MSVLRFALIVLPLQPHQTRLLAHATWADLEIEAADEWPVAAVGKIGKLSLLKLPAGAHRRVSGAVGLLVRPNDTEPCLHRRTSLPLASCAHS